MNIIKDKKAMALPYVLGIVIFVVGVVATLISYAVFQARLIQKNTESTESYINAVQSINATIHIIIREESLDPTFLQDLADYMDVSITEYSPDVWLISKTSTDSVTVRSYISGIDTSISIIDNQFSYTGEETDFIQNPDITAESLFYNYTAEFLESVDPTVNPSTTYNNYNAVFSTLKNSYSTYISNYISPVFTYYSSATKSFPGYPSINTMITNNQVITDNRYVNGSITIGNNKTLAVEEGKVLVIDGSITMNTGSTIRGVVFVNGNISMPNRTTNQTIEGTVYVDGTIKMIDDVYLGDSLRPTFIITSSTVTVGNGLYGYGYIIADSTSVGWLDDVSITGGIYPFPTGFLVYPEVFVNTNLNESDLFNYGIVASIPDPNVVGESVFKYTLPK